MKIRARGVGTARALAAVACLATISAIPAVAQEKPSLQELLGRAQSQSEKKAVEDLIEKLKPAPKQQPVVETAKPDAKPEAKVQEQQQVRETKPAVVEVEKTTAVSTPAASGTDVKAEGKAASTREETPAVDQKAAVATDKPTAPVEAVSKSEPEPAAKATPVPVEVAVERAERKQLPSVDLEVLFEFNSAKMTEAAVEALRPLGHALSDERLADGQFLIAGHTDGKGKADYNLELSQRRADAVREFLMENFKIDGSRLVAKGFGESRLKNPQRPRAAENRRVQVVNLTSAAASR
jgi:outer membrane protein OmpA-like peptidoglycan-associated protein